MKNKFPIAKILILVTILAVPGFLYYLLQAKGQNRYKPLPVYGPKVLSGTFKEKRGKRIPDTTYHQIKDFKAIDQNGAEFKLSDVKEQLIVVNFFYSSCDKACPKVFENLSWLFKEYADNKIVRFISISVDPETDTPESLSKFAATHKAVAGKWDFLSADTSVVYPLAKEQFFVNALKSKDGFVHSDKLILLDANHRIRGYYDGVSSQEVKDFKDEIIVLITEELRKVKVDL